LDFLRRNIMNRILIFIVTLTLFPIVASAESTQPEPRKEYRDYVYSSDNCLFEVTFPEKHETKDVSTAIVEYEQAELVTNDSFFRVECPYIALENPVSQIKTSLEMLGIADGLRGVTITNDSKSASYIFLKMRGYKDIAEIPTTYSVFAYYKDNSLLLLTVASKSKNYPTNSIHNFLSSVKIKSITE